MADDHSQQQEEHQASRDNEKRSRFLSVASLALGLISIIFTLGAVVLLPSFVVGLGILCAVLGLALGIYQVLRLRSGRILPSTGAFFSIVGVGLSVLVAIGLSASAITHVELLKRMGYDQVVIDNPISVEYFEVVGQPTAQWIYSGFVAPLGWYSNEQELMIPLDIPLTGSNPTEPISFDPSASMFGLFMRVDGIYEWFTESARNKDGESHIKVYPVIANGREVPNSYLIFWEDFPLDEGPNRLVDFTDLIVRVDGVRLVSTAAE